MKLFIYEHCPFCARASLALGLKDVPHETAVIMEGDVETPTRMIGRKMVPILQKDDGTCMGESLDIVRYVDELGTPMLAGPPEAALDAWAKDGWPVFARLVVPRFTRGNFAELATAEAREAFRQRETRAFGDLDSLIDDTPALAAQAEERPRALAPLLEGRDRIAISDVTLWPVLRSLTIVCALDFPPAVRSYTEKLSAKGKVSLLFEQAM